MRGTGVLFLTEAQNFFGSLIVTNLTHFYIWWSMWSQSLKCIRCPYDTWPECKGLGLNSLLRHRIFSVQSERASKETIKISQDFKTVVFEHWVDMDYKYILFFRPRFFIALWRFCLVPASGEWGVNYVFENIYYSLKYTRKPIITWGTMEFSLNGTEIQLIKRLQGIW